MHHPIKGKLLCWRENRYRGCWVGLDMPAKAEQFSADLALSLDYWAEYGIKVVWLTLPKNRVDLYTVALDKGFDLHHVSNVGEKAIVLTKRLQKEAFIPDYAHHIVGVGGIVFNAQGQVLTIVEKHDMQTRPGHFKFPGGAVDKDELIAAAVQREVFEETGINTTFHGVVGFHHNHRGQFGTSNLYFLCHLTAKNTDIIPCPDEIGMARWVNVGEYLSCDTVMNFNKTMLQAALKANYLHLTDIGEIMNITAKDYEIYT